MRRTVLATCSSLFLCWVIRLLVISTAGTEAVGEPDGKQIRIKAAILLTSGSNLAYDYYNLAPVIDLAVQRALQDYNVTIDLQLALYQGQCNVSQAVGQAVQAIIANVDLIIGPACTPDMVAVSQITTYYKLSLLTGAGSLTDSTDAFPWTTRASYNTYSQWLFFVTIAARYSWRHMAVIYDRDDDNNLTNAKSLIRHLQDKNFKAVELTFKGGDYMGFRSAEEILTNLTVQARIAVILTTSVRVRQMMLQAQRMGLNNGDYAFFVLDLFHGEYNLDNDADSQRGWKQNDMFDQEALTAYRLLFALALKTSKQSIEYRTFEKRLRQKAQIPAYGRPLDVNYYSLSFYDAISMYAMALKETAQDNISVSHNDSYGSAGIEAIIRHLSNITFAGAAGSIYMNTDADRIDDFELYQLSATSDGKFRAVSQMLGFEGKYRETEAISWLSADGKPPANRPFCGFDGNDPICLVQRQKILGGSLGAVFLFLLLSGLIALAVARYLGHRKEMNNLDWLVSWNEVFIYQRVRSSASRSSIHTGGSVPPEGGTELPAATNRPKTAASSVPMLLMPFRLHSKSTLTQKESDIKTRETINKSSTVVATVRGVLVIIRMCEGAHVDLNKGTRQEVRTVKGLNNENLMKFMGACIERQHVSVFGEYCSRGTLQDVLFNDVITLDWAFRLSFINDLLRAISFLQSSTVFQCHGRLTSKCCYIDKRFVLKVGDFGLPSFYNTTSAIDKREPADMLWSAPEILRSRSPNKASADGDIFAFAIILSEIITRESPYYKSNVGPEEVVRRVERSEHPPFRPNIDDPFVNQEIMFVMQSCWADTPANRLKIPQVRNCLRLLSKTNGNENKSNIIDTLLERIEQHAQSLEDSVEEKTQALVEEKKKTDHLLYSILPKSIADQLKRGENVFPESYEGVTIYFGDIVGFTLLSSSSTPMEIVNLMNDLYYQFDQIIAGFDAYKVETVGDCYVIASGLPNRNGQKHASEMGRLALTLREAAKTFKIRHRPGMPIELRIGLNSGPCVAGVVGFQTPKYCLFGDTVNTASRMESTGEAMRIQMTEATRNILQFFASFDIVARGVVPVKGKGEMTTYWLEGLKSPNPPDGTTNDTYAFPPATAPATPTSMVI